MDGVICFFEDVVVGCYVVLVFYDFNENGKVDICVFGILKELWGVFNGVCFCMCVFKFEEVVFDFVEDEDKIVEVKVK